jgi:hypothetical protein
MQAPDETVMVFLCGNTGRDDRVKVKNRQYRQGSGGEDFFAFGHAPFALIMTPPYLFL